MIMSSRLFAHNKIYNTYYFINLRCSDKLRHKEYRDSAFASSNNAVIGSSNDQKRSERLSLLNENIRPENTPEEVAINVAPLSQKPSSEVLSSSKVNEDRRNDYFQ